MHPSTAVCPVRNAQADAFLALLAATAPAPAAAPGPSPFALGAGPPGSAPAWRGAFTQGAALRALCMPLPAEVWARPAPDSWDTAGALQALLRGGAELAVEPHTPPRPDAAAGSLAAHGAESIPDGLVALASFGGAESEPDGYAASASTDGADLSDADGEAATPMVGDDALFPCTCCWLSLHAESSCCALVC